MNSVSELAQDHSKSVIYCRAATSEADHSKVRLKDQEATCRLYADRRGYEVVEAFFDEGFSGLKMERPGWQALLSFLDDNPRHIVLVPDISRLARSGKLYLRMQDAIAETGGKLEWPNADALAGADGECGDDQ